MPISVAPQSQGSKIDCNRLLDKEIILSQIYRCLHSDLGPVFLLLNAPFLPPFRTVAPMGDMFSLVFLFPPGHLTDDSDAEIPDFISQAAARYAEDFRRLELITARVPEHAC